ncbi:starch synthase [Rhodovulum iodosum]|uniref:Glycogen synthase n=1 Tax=Rhodovulum iodosum TaxID=68291 RepID=A0ABV3XWN9_9RHOB|nr:glycogen synthase GlgA [Rhodovulum robiginosum]RSK34214.1 glycogen synthase GlgA [Rhodovulum robiginosum]
MTRVLSVASECAPLVKTGGLADVVGALPGALAAEGCQMRVLLPGYRAVLDKAGDLRPVHDLPYLFGAQARVLAGQAAGLELYVIDAPHLYDRPGGPYMDEAGRDWDDNDLRFAALSFVAAVIADEGIDGWRPEVLHCHDWQAGFAPVYLQVRGAQERTGTVMTVHNIAFHGLTAADRLEPLGLPGRSFSTDGFEYYGDISALKAGLVFSDRLTTVSPTYARELMTPEFGHGLDGVLRTRRADLAGILNGIDDTVWNPAQDPHIAPYKQPRGKAKNRAALIEEMGLSDGEGPLCVVVSRLSEQKGLDLLLEALPALLEHGGRLALLGSGDRALEEAWLAAAETQEGVAVRIGYDEALSHRMFAGGDAVLVPSRFEPCGLTQLYGLRYGTVPVVARTGGLADTVIAANEAGLRAGVATGVLFRPDSEDALEEALTRTCALYRDEATWRQLRRNGMRHPVGWGPAAAEYAALYRSVARP